jgi:hypothetical protein
VARAPRQRRVDARVVAPYVDTRVDLRQHRDRVPRPAVVRVRVRAREDVRPKRARGFGVRRDRGGDELAEHRAALDAGQDENVRLERGDVPSDRLDVAPRARGVRVGGVFERRADVQGRDDERFLFSILAAIDDRRRRGRALLGEEAGGVDGRWRQRRRRREDDEQREERGEDAAPGWRGHRARRV